MVSGMPEARSICPKRRTAVVRSRGPATLPLGGHEALEPARVKLALEALDVVGVLEYAAKSLEDQLLVHVVSVQRGQGLGPVEGLGHPGDLGEPDGAQALHEA